MTALIELYRAHLEQRHFAPTSVVKAARNLRNFGAWLHEAGVDDLRDATRAHIERYRELLNASPLSPHYRNSLVRLVAHFFAFLHARGKILVNPCAELPPLRAPKRLPRGVIYADQVMRLLQQPNTNNPGGFRDRVILELLYSTALRGLEACRLSVYDLNLPERTLRVIQGKGRKDRVVPMGRVAAHYLAEYLAKVRPILLAGRLLRPSSTAQARSPDALFLSSWGLPLSTAFLGRLLRRYVAAAGLPETVTVHSLRHACATEMLRGGASIRHVQEMLGHAEINTAQIYTRLAPFDLKKVHQRAAPSERRKAVETPVFQNKGCYKERKRPR